MLKKLVCVFMVFVLLSQVCVNVGIAINYQVNKTTITEKLCVNKAKPQMRCNGHCYLSKQLKKAEQDERKHAKDILKEKEEIISGQCEILPARYYPSFLVMALPYFKSSQRSTTVELSLLKPPSV